MDNPSCSRRLAIWQPTEESQEHPPKVLLNDGKEMFAMHHRPDPAALGGDYHTCLAFLQNQQQDLLQHAAIPKTVHQTLPSQHKGKLRLKVSKATRVVKPEPTPSPEDIIVLSDDDEEEQTSKSCSSSKSTFRQIFSNLKNQREENNTVKQTEAMQVSHPQGSAFVSYYPSMPKQSGKVLSVNKHVPRLSRKTFLDVPSPKSPDMKIQTKVTEHVQEKAESRIQLRVGTYDEDLTELFQLIQEIDQIQPEKPKEKLKSFKQGKVVDGEKDAVVELLNHHESLKTGVTGVLCSYLEPSFYEEYSEEQFSVIKRLGSGTFGGVDLCQDVSSKKQFIRKKVTKDFRVSEVVVLLLMDHPNITSLYGFISREGVPEILLQYSGTNLLNYVFCDRGSDSLRDDEIWNVAKQGLSALDYLDKHKIIHFDIKPENLCISENKVLQITDFGSAKTSMEEMDYLGWTAEYMPPEMCRSFLISKYPNMFANDRDDFIISGKADVFAFGLVILFMYEKTHTMVRFFTNGQTSYKNIIEPDKIRLNIIIANARDPNFVQKLMITDRCDQNMSELLHGILNGVPRNRLSAEEALDKIAEMEYSTQPATPSLTDAFGSKCRVSISQLHRRRSVVRQNSVMSICSNYSVQIDGDPASPGPLKTKKRGKKRPRPYDHEDDHPIEVDENLVGNVPNFSAF